jgi:phytanoyl-CoA hydroxylase
MKHLFTPRGLAVSVPETETEDPSPRFNADDEQQLTALRSYYNEQGYAIARNCIEADLCDQARKLWREEVKPFGGYMYRQATAKAERHTFNRHGWVMNPILNLQSIDPQRFPRLRSHATERVLANPRLKRVLEAVLGGPPKIVQSMYFEGNSATWEHQDSYYLDSFEVGSMTAAWIALEDIDAEAGRFFVAPGSHKLELIRQTSNNNVAQHHEIYIREVVQSIRDRGLGIRAPALRKGDVLIWNALTIHGSLNSQSEQATRASMTCHAIHADHDFLQLHTRRLRLPVDEVRGTYVYRPKDLAKAENRAVLWLESRFPGPFYGLKRFVLSKLVALRNG